MPTDSRALPLLDAYEFGVRKGLAEQVNEISSMVIDELELPRHRTMVRRSYIASLFADNGCLEEFIETCWPNGQTHDGERRMRNCEAMRKKYEELMGGEDEPVGENDRGDDGGSEQRFALESQLRDFLAHNLSVLEPGLTLYEQDGRRGIEFPVDSGRIDVLAVDKQGKHVVIELKLSQGRNRALGQLLYYMGWVDKNLANSPSRGFIVAQEISEELKTAAARVPGIELFQYKVSMSVSPVTV